MKSFEFDIVIIGGGCIGCSILYELTRRGFSNIALIDEGRKILSATAHSGGMLRVFHENIEHVQLALTNHSLLHQYSQSMAAHSLLDIQRSKPNGSLYFFNKHRFQNFKPHLESMRAAQYPFDILNETSGKRQFPQFHWKTDEWAIYEPLGSQTPPLLWSEDLLSKSIRAGATLIDNFLVQRICRYNDQYRISSKEAVVTTKSLVLAGGARLLPRLQDLALKFPLTSKTITTFVARKKTIQIDSIKQKELRNQTTSRQAEIHLEAVSKMVETELASSSVPPNYFDRETLEFGGFGHPSLVTLSSPNPQRLFTMPFWEDAMDKREAEDCYAPHRMGFSGQVSGFPQLYMATGWGGTGFKFALAVGNRMAAAIEQGRHERRYHYALL